MNSAARPWKVTAKTPPAVGGALRPVSAALVLLLCSSAATANSDGPLNQALSSTATQLNEGWLGDPESRGLPFPRLQILKDPASIQATCPDRADLRLATGRAVYCPRRGAILVDASAFTGDNDARAWPLRYWIAIGLAETISARSLTSSLISASTSPVVSSLEHQCMAGILLAASRLTTGMAAEVMLAPALSAYPLSKASVVGSHGQRGYALLTGLGATELTCSAIDMQALSESRVPDPEVLNRITKLSRANSSLMAVLNSQCRPRPRATCPRRLHPRTPSP